MAATQLQGFAYRCSLLINQPELYRGVKEIHTDACGSRKRKAAGDAASVHSDNKHSKKSRANEIPAVQRMTMRDSTKAHSYCCKKLGSVAYRRSLLINQPQLYRGSLSLASSGKRKVVADLPGDGETYTQAPPFADAPVVPDSPAPKQQKLAHDEAGAELGLGDDTGIPTADLATGALIAVYPDEGYDSGQHPFWLARIDKAATQQRETIDVTWLESPDGKTYYIGQKDPIPTASIICVVRSSCTKNELSLTKKEAASVILAMEGQ